MKNLHLLRITIAAGLSLLVCNSVLAAVVQGHKPPGSKSSRTFTPVQGSYASDHIIVRYRETQAFGPAQANALNSQLDTQVVHSFSHLRGIEVVKGLHGQSVKELLSAYRRNPNVLYAEPDYRVEIQLTPDDTRYPEMWALNNTGQTGGIADADINAPEAWDITTGSTAVVVGEIDTGIDYTHPDLAANLWTNPGEIPGNGIDDDGDGYIDDVHGINAITNSGDPFDDNGHGTHTAGTIGAVGNNSLGVVGVSQQVSIVACKFLDSSGGGSTSDAIKCFDYLLALKSRGVNVVLSSNSWGGGGYSAALSDAIKANQDAGILTVIAAGNAATNTDIMPSYPASYDLPGILSVAATDASDQLASFSNYGASTVDVGAPGVAILSTFPVASTCLLCTAVNQYDPAGYGVISGTSMATPQVAGLAALLKAQDPSRTAMQIKNLIMTGGQSIPALQGKTVSGRRIRAADIAGVGSLTCVNQAVAHRIAPSRNSILVVPGNPINLQYVDLNCDHAVTDTITATIQPSGEIITLHDDGVAPDVAAGDGIYSADYVPTAKGSITFPGNDVVLFDFIRKYLPASFVDYNYRTLSSNASRLGMMDEEFWTGPFSQFPIRFRDESPGYVSMSIGSNGYIGFDGGNFFDNTPLPALPYAGLPYTVETFIAAFWDDLNPADDPINNPDQAVFYETQGVAPNREFIVEFRDMPNKLGLATDTGTFEVVFFENNSDVLVNYKDVTFGNPAVDYGAEATIGIQSHPTLFQQESYNTAFLADNMSILWQLSRPPVADAGPDQVVNFGNQVTLDGSGSTDDRNDIRSYSWTQLSGSLVSLTDADKPVATFVAPNTPGTSTFELSVIDGDGHSTTSTVSIRVNNPPTATATTVKVANFGDSVTLNGSGTDSDGTIASYSWSQIAGAPITLVDGNKATASFVVPANSAGTMTLQLTVTDNDGGTDTSSVSFRVNNPPIVDVTAVPVVNFGKSVSLDGSGSTDTDGSITNYAWSQTGGTSVTLANGDTSTAAFAAPNSAGVLTFSLTLTDNDGANNSNSISVRVNNPPTVTATAPPSVNAGDSVTLSGSARDSDGTVASYSWTQTSGVSVNLANSNKSIASFTAPGSAGVVSFRLTVTDNNGATATTTVNTTVNVPPKGGGGGAMNFYVLALFSLLLVAARIRRPAASE